MRNFKEVNAYLNGLMSETRSRREGYTLDRMQALMAYLDNPQNSYRTIHVAGTSGKSSTCYFLGALLRAGGKKVGVGISPHVDEVNERVQVNGLPLAENEFCREFSIFVQQIQPSGIQPTYFELLVAFAFWEFARQQVEYAVIEVGLGGLLDGTNVINRAAKVCVITDIGYDHTATLGKTLTAIAGQKAGIILPGNNVFSYQQSDEVMNVFRQVCEDKGASLQVVKSSPESSDLPLFQQRNWHLAHAVYEYLTDRDGLPQLDAQMLAQTTHIHIPGRMEVFHLQGKTIILDGAHNPQKLQALVGSIQHAYPGTSVACLVSFVRINELKVQDNLKVLLPLTSHAIITSFHDEAAEHYSTDPQIIAQSSQALGYEATEIIPDPQAALDALLKRPEKLLLITGSFFLLQHLRPLILQAVRKANPDRFFLP